MLSKEDFWVDGEFPDESILGKDKKFCETEYCYKVVWKWNKCCEYCQLNLSPVPSPQIEEKKVYCKILICRQEAEEGEKYCSSCKNDEEILSIEDCMSCLSSRYLYGKVDNCCFKHSKYCQICRSRIPIDSKYCSEHSSSCLTCSSRISINQTYCSVHQNEQEKLQENLKSLIRQRNSLSNPQEVIRFETWWNNNLATVINGNYSYTLWILVYEPVEKNRSEILQKFEISNGYDKSSLGSAQNRASGLRNELNGENPILAIVGYHGSMSVNSLLSEPYLIKKEVPCRMETYKDKRPVPYPADEYFYRDQWWEYHEAQRRIYPDNPDEYLKPLDV